MVSKSLNDFLGASIFFRKKSHFIIFTFTEYQFRPENLQHTAVPLITNDACIKKYIPYPEFGIKITSNMVCTGFKHGGRDSCTGDSGFIFS